MRYPFKSILTKEVLEQDYIKNKLPVTEIARKYGTTTLTVHNYIKKHGIKLRGVIKDLTGMRFGKLIAIRLSNKRDNHGKARWRCKCDCGSSADINSGSLIRGLTKSCGCHSKEVCRKGGYKDISRSFWRRLVQNAMQRGYKFTITPEYIWRLYKKQNKKCPFTGLFIEFFPDSNRMYRQTASIDRIDSNRGYVRGNIQIVHKVINQMKSFLSDEEFVSFCNLVARRNPRDYEDSINKTSRSILRKIRPGS